MIACAFALSPIVKVLLETGQAQPHARDDHGRTALIYAVNYQCFEEVEVLTRRYMVDINMRDNIGDSPLTCAVYGDNEQTNILRLLLSFDHLDIGPNSSGNSILGQAAQGGSPEKFELIFEFLDGRFDPDTSDNIGRTALSYAAEMLQYYSIQALLDTKKVDVNSRDTDGRTPLHHAATPDWEESDAFEALLEAQDIEVDPRDLRARTPLSLAAEHGFYDMVDALVKVLAVEVDCKDETGRTPLSYAAETGYLETVRILLATGRADVETEDVSGRTPLWWAEHPGDKQKTRNKNDRQRVWEMLCEHMYRQQASRHSHALSIKRFGG